MDLFKYIFMLYFMYKGVLVIKEAHVLPEK